MSTASRTAPTADAPRAASAARAAGDPFRVLIADAISASGLKPLADDGAFEIIERAGLSPDELAHALEDVDAVIVRSASRITRESLRYAGRLRVIGRAGVGVDNIDVDAATERGVAVLNAPAGNTVSAAELAFALLLALVRRVPAADRSMKAGEWDRKSYTGVELYGKTLGLVGAGRIGSEVARRARAFGMRVIASDPFLTPERAKALEIELVSLDDVLARADVVSLHVPLTDATSGLIGETQLKRLKPGVFIVNAARGGVIDEDALHRSLLDGRIAGAALDVFAEEPLPKQHPLRALPNVVLTPHLGAATAEAQQNVALEIAAAVHDALLHGDLSCAVNAPAIGGEEMRRLRPLLELSETLGRLSCALSEGAIQRLEVRYAGAAEDALRSLASAALIGVLDEVVGRGAVNFVNAIHFAQTRGITLGRTRLAQHSDYAEYVELRSGTDQGDVLVAGALLDATHPRVVRINDFHVDIRPRGALVILRNRDVPGVIGRVGTVLGGAAVNIAEYHQARLEQGGEALAAISVDDWLSEDVLAALAAVNDVIAVKQVQLD
jgi:D-3-phosphoglycerate dehydrogenase